MFIGKRVVDFLVLIELFSLGVTAYRRFEQISVQNQRFRSNGGRLTQSFRYKRSHLINHCSSEKTRLYAVSYVINIWTDLSSVLPCVGETDGLTDRQTEFSSLDCISIQEAQKHQGR